MNRHNTARTRRHRATRATAISDAVCITAALLALVLVGTVLCLGMIEHMSRIGL